VAQKSLHDWDDCTSGCHTGYVCSKVLRSGRLNTTGDEQTAQPTEASGIRSVPQTMDFLEIAAAEGGPDDVLYETARVIRDLARELGQLESERERLVRQVDVRSEQIDFLARVVTRRLDQRASRERPGGHRSAGAA
jgi:hypothetical protein